MSVGPQNLSPMDQDVIISWVALVMCTLHQVGLDVPGAEALVQSTDPTEKGLRDFVSGTLSRVAQVGTQRNK